MPPPPSTTLPVAVTVATSAATPAPTSGSPTTVPAGPGGIEATWRAVAGSVDGTAVTLIETSPITRVIEAGEAGGIAACNAYGGFVEVTDTTIEFLGVGSTEMGCEGPVMELEQTYLGSIGAAQQQIFDYLIVGTSLTLSAPAATWIFEWVVPTPDAELVGTTWVLNDLIDPAGYAHTSGMEAGTLRLDPDGTVTGSTSCRELTATWSADGDGVQFDDLVVTGACTAELADVDDQVVHVLEGPVSVHIDADHLVLMAQNGTGLGFLAR